LKRFVSFGAVLLLVALGTVTLAPGAQAADQFRLAVNRGTVFSGGHLTATVGANVTCDFLVSWNGEDRSGAGRSFATTFTAPRVTRITKLRLEATCFVRRAHRSAPPVATAPVRATSVDTQTIVVTVPESLRRSIMITVLPAAGGGGALPPNVGPGGGGTGGAGLPNTGGPRLLLLLLGAASVLTGAGVVAATRRRRSAPTPS
jgi:hypothetical protein